MENNFAAIVVGGSNGVGLSIADNLIKRNYHVYIVDFKEPPIKSDSITYIHTDLRFFDENLFQTLNKNNNIKFLIITAGIGKICEFDNLHIADINNTLTINSTSAIKIISVFYEKIKSNIDFHCIVMGSIAGLCSSPLFSVYCASKAAVCRFIESVNIELEIFGTTNRILNVSPGNIKGTNFYGEENDLDSLKNLADEILEKSLANQELFIPDYEKTYKNVLAKYHENPNKFGLDSYSYKLNSDRVLNSKTAKIGYLSGTFDLFHIGHLNILKRAKENCDYLIVGVHKDASHKGKKEFIPFDERKEIVESIKYVDKVVESCKEDSDAWDKWRFNILFVGSDYKGTKRFLEYENYFSDKDVKIIYFPYTKGTSSTQIRNEILDKD